MDETTFLSKVDRSGSCWLWTGVTNWSGYGFMYDERGRRWYVHRYAYDRLVGPIPPRVCVLHKCDTRACVRPDHLRLGTRAENSREMVERGRSLRGSQHPNARLTDAQVRAIFACRQAGMTQRAIGEAFGVSRQCIGQVLNGTRRGVVGL